MLPATTISPWSSCFNFETSSTASPFSTLVLFHSGSRGSRRRRTWACCSACPPGPVAGWPPRGQELVCPPTEQLRLGAQRLIEQPLAGLGAVRDLADPTAVLEALDTGRVLDDSIERDVLADDDLPHFGPPFVGGCQLRHRRWRTERPVARRPSVRQRFTLVSHQIGLSSRAVPAAARPDASVCGPERSPAGVRDGFRAGGAGSRVSGVRRSAR